MAAPLEYVEHLAQVIGPRPAGTEEEQQASTYIKGLFADEAGLEAEIEEFNCNPSFELPRAICSAAVAVLAILALILPLTIMPALIITILLAVFYILEVIGKGPLTRTTKNGISQSVLAKYIPAVSDSEGERDRARQKRKRKIVLIAHYDTGKVRKELTGPMFKILNIVHWVELVGIVLVPILLALLLATNSADSFHSFFSVLLIICAIVSFLPTASFVSHQTSPYNSGANCNAAGVAVMVEAAKRVASSKRIQEQEQQDIEMMGEAAILESGLIPEGAELVYSENAGSANDAQGSSGRRRRQADQREELQPRSAQSIENPLAEKVPAARTGAGVDAVFGDTASFDNSAHIQQNTIDYSPVADQAQAQAQDPEAMLKDGQQAELASAGQPVGQQPAVSAQEASSPAQAPAVEVDDGIPDWFKKGRNRAQQKRPEPDGQASSFVQRSRFADALDAAQASVEAANEQVERAEAAPSIAEIRLQQMRESIMGQAAQAQKSVSSQGKPEPATRASQQASGNAATATNAPATTATTEPAHAHSAGVSGYLSNTTESTDYASAAAQEAAAAASAAEGASAAAAQATEQAATAAALAKDAASLVAESDQAERESVTTINEEQAAKAERTMSFIPVGINEEEVLKGTNLEQAAKAHAEQSKQQDKEAPVQAGRKKRSISLPSLTGAIEGVSAKLQDSPLSEEVDEETVRKRNQQERLARQEALVSSLPSTAGASSPASTGSIARTGSMPAIEDQAEEVENVTVNTAGSFIDASSTSSFEPVGDELIQDVPEDEIYIEDADDSDYDSQFTATGAAAGPGYVDMPKTRAGRMFGRFRRKKDKNADAEQSLGEVLGVDESFDARKVGAARGGWESFREDNVESAFDDSFDNDDDWNGGAFSKLREMASGSGGNGNGRAGGNGEGRSSRSSRGAGRSASGSRSANRDGATRSRRNSSRMEDNVPMYSPSADVVDEDLEEFGAQYASTDYAADYAEAVEGVEQFEGQPEGARQRRRRSSFGDLPLSQLDTTNEDREMIQQFRSGAVQTEVWFVALGAELADNAGIKAFIREHQDELKGSIIIALNGLGAGTLSAIEEEGMFVPVKTSSRMKRYINKAAAALGLRLGKGKMLWRDTSVYYAARKGFQTIHLAGIMSDKPAYCAEADDIVEHISEEKLEQSSDYVMELIRSI